MKKYLKPILWTVGIVVLLIGLYIFNQQFTLNFASLGIALLLICVITSWYYRSYSKKKGMNLAANAYGLLTAMIIVAFGMLCVITINNYFAPKQEVFSNGDHHVVQIEGLEITNPKGFVLAANSTEALFDNEATTGSAVVASVDDSTVMLKLSPDFQRVIYKETYDPGTIALKQLEMQNSLGTIGKGERLLIATNTNGKKDTLEFTTRFDVYDWPSDWEILSHDVDTMRYYINGHESDTHSYLRRGLPMSQVIAGLKADSMRIDLDNLHIIRPHAYINGYSQHRLKEELYKDERFAFEMHGSSKSKIEAISTDGKTWRSVKPNKNKGYNGETIELKKGEFYSIGYGSGKSTSFKLGGKGDTLEITFRMPFMRYLHPSPDRPDNLVLLTQSLNLTPNGVDKSFGMLPDNIMLFDFFHHPDNKNRIYPKQLAYTVGPTTEALTVGVYDFHRHQSVPHENISNGMVVTQTQAMGNNNVNWKVSIQDLKANNTLYQPTKIKWCIVALTLILAIIMLWGNVRLDKRYDRYLRPMFSTVEFVAYMVTIYLVTIRWFLLWRTAVFPPVEHVSPYDFYGMFEKAQNQRYFIVVLGAFVAIVILIKALAIFGGWARLKKVWLKLMVYADGIAKKAAPKVKAMCKGNKLAMMSLRALMVILLIIIFAVIQFAPSLGSMTWIGILCPVMVYMLATILIHTIGSRNYDEPLGASDKEVLETLRRKNRVFLADIANAFITAAALTIVDSGYGILFLTFSVFWLLWELYDFVHVPDVTLSNGQVIKTWSRWTVALIPLMLLSYVLLIANYKEIFKYLADGGMSHYLTCAIFGAVIGLCIFLVLYGARIRQSWKKAIGWAVVPFLLFGTVAFGFDWYLESKAQHTVERIRVHFDTPDEALVEIGDDATQRRYIQAALNHAIIGEYNDRGADISIIGENGTGYFKMQPHSPVGAMWGAQLSDISPVRFLIAEHSRALGVIIVLMFLLMLGAGARQVKHHRFARCTLVQVPLLLLVQSLLIWMANTQRFIFLGQDLPMISINSSLSIAFYFSLIILWLTVMFYEKSTESQLSRDVDNKTRVYVYDVLDNESKLEFFMISAVFAMCVALAIFAKSKVQTDGFMPVQAMAEVDRIINGNYDDDESSSPLLATADSIDSGDAVQVEDFTLNGLFLRYQKENRKKYFAGGNDTYIDAYGHRHEKPMPIDMASLTKIISDFNEARADSIKMLFGVDKDSPRPHNALAQNMWQNFVENGVMHNNRNNVMHAHLKSDGYLAIGIFNRFYNQKLPDPNATQWKGSIVASASGGEAMVGETKQNGVNMYVLPGAWMRNGRATALATGKAQIEGEGMVFVLDDSINVAAQVPAGYSVAGFDNRVPDTDYLARNVRVNGSQTFVYPLGQKFYWARDIAQEAANRKAVIKREHGDDALPANFDHDIALTISPSLTETIYDIFAGKNDNTHRAVIVANGDGKIMAMVDYKKRFALDPNDHRRISEISDSLYIIGRLGSSTARNYFGNANLMALRYGPGSTQKPLTWTAVASGIDYPWKDLRIAAYEGIKTSGKYFLISQFNEKPFLPGHPLKTLCSDEKYGSVLSLNDYLARSSNVYNALMVYIGSWPKDHYDKDFLTPSNRVDGNHLFASFNNSISYVDAFPVMLDYRNKRIRLNSHPMGTEESWLDNSLLQENLEYLFGIGRSLKDSDGKMRTRSFFEISKDYNVDKHSGSKRKITPSNSFIEPSALLSEVRSAKSDSTSTRYFMETGIRSTAIGAQIVWNVTPIDMAQAFGRMASLNRDFNLTVLDSSQVAPSYKAFEGLSDGYLDARQTQFKGMNDIFKEGTVQLRTQKGYYRPFPNGTVTSNDNKTYYLYAKTGTIGEGKDNHRFAVIITDRALFTDDGQDDLNDMKYYVLYFTYTMPGFMEYKKVIEEVVNSKEFDAYMNGN